MIKTEFKYPFLVKEAYVRYMMYTICLIPNKYYNIIRKISKI